MNLSEAAVLAERLRPAIGSDRVLAAIASIPRHLFVPPDERARAYENIALPIGHGQTISQPLVVARMLESLELGANDRVLDIGTGSGYHAALLSLLAARVWSIELDPELSAMGRQSVSELGLDNVTLLVGDGADGLPGEAPFDAINVAAATGDSVLGPLAQQLALGGRLVAPVGEREQHLILIRRTSSGFTQKRLEAVRFVPLVHGGDGRG